MAVFDNETQSFWVSPQTKGQKWCAVRRIVKRETKNFDASRSKEIDNLEQLGALSVLSVKDSEHFAKTKPENIIPTNMLDKWKRQDDGTVKGKSRIVLVGWKDPMVYKLNVLHLHRLKRPSC